MPGCNLPDIFVRVWDLWESGKEVEAEREFRKYTPIIQTLAQGLGLANWIYKDILVHRGIFQPGSAFARHPALQPDQAARDEMTRLLDDLGITA
jgi:dihydrodipicolinate synthase/N-acetylneuraminate lyase